jgi:hypothetical protein
MISVSGKRCRVLADQIDAMSVRQLKIGEQYPGRAFCKAGAGVRERACRPYLIAGLGKRILQPPKGRRVVLHQQDGDGLGLRFIAR